MFFYLSKIVWFVLQPSTLLTGLALLGALACFTRFARAGRGLALLALLGLLAAGLSPLGNALLIPLEDRFTPPPANAASPHGIIILGGSLDTAASKARASAELNEAAERLTMAAELSRIYPGARLIFSGGDGSLFGIGETESQSARKLLSGLGIDAARITYEDRSRNTWENALFSRDLAGPQPGEVWWLVTSAFHMPRAIGCFRQAGFPVLAYPVDYRTRGPADYWRGFDALSAGLRRVDMATREWLGLLVYRITGRIGALLPRP